MELEHLLENAFDMHVHSGPDILARKVDDLELARRFSDRKMNGYCIKSHFFCTGERAAIIRKIYPDCNVTGGLVLSSACGGLNPTAVEMAALSGARILWLPTTDSKYERSHVFGKSAVPGSKKPFWANILISLQKKGIDTPEINLLNENGKLLGEVYEILDICRDHNMVVATGHISHTETFAVAKAAQERGVDRFVVTHVNFPTTFYSIEEQITLRNMGAYMEHCYTTYATGKVDFSLMLEQIRAVGVDRVIISTDLGQPTNVYPDEGMYDFSKRLFENGFTEDEIMKMNGTTPRMLVS